MGIYSIEPKSEVLNEVYFGETPGIMRCFDAFSAWRSKYLMERKVYMINSAAERDPLLGKFVSEMEREFGLYSYSFVIVNSDSVNAFTFIPQFNFNSSLKGPKRVEFGKDSYKFKKECQVSMLTCMFAGMFFNNNYTNREIFAIILHEVGHNFQDVISDKMFTISSLATLNKVVMAGMQIALGNIAEPLAALLVNDVTIGAVSKTYNEMNIGQKNSLISTLNCIYGVTMDTVNLLATPLFILPIQVGRAMYRIIKKTALSMIMTPLVRRHEYYGEVMADKFASYYGFGKDLVSALNKIDDSRTGAGMSSIMMNIPIYSHLQELVMLPINFLLDAVDCHPANQVRYKTILDGLNDDLDRPGMSPKLKKQLKADIKETEDTVEEILENGKKIDDPRIVKNYVHSFLYHSCGGDPKYVIKKMSFDSEKDVQNTYIKNTKIK